MYQRIGNQFPQVFRSAILNTNTRDVFVQELDDADGPECDGSVAEDPERVTLFVNVELSGKPNCLSRTYLMLLKRPKRTWRII